MFVEKANESLEMSNQRSDVAAYILADHRENNGAIPYLSAAVDHNNNANSAKLPWKSGGGNLLYQILNNGTVGDYTIMLPSKQDASKNIIAAVFERKTWKDLAASIKDQRSIHQHKSLTEFESKHGCYIYYIMEGPMSYAEDTEIGRLPFKNLHAKMRSLSLRGAHSFQTKSPDHTAWLLANLARDLAKLYRQDQIAFPLQEVVASPIELSESEREKNAAKTLFDDLTTAFGKYNASTSSLVDQQENSLIINAMTNMISLIQGFVPPPPVSGVPETDGEFDIFQDASLPEEKQHEPIKLPIKQEPIKQEPIKEEPKVHIPEQLKTRAVRSYTDILMRMWCEIPRITTKSAPIIMRKIDIKELICCLPENKIKLRDVIAHLSFTGGTKIGQVKADAIMQVSSNGIDPLNMPAARDIHAKILSQVPLISQEVANAILEVTDLHTICRIIMEKNRFRTEDLEDLIADVKRPKGVRKLGKAAAKKIIEIISSEPDLSQLPTE